MESVKQRLMVRYGSHPAFPTIVRDIAEILEEADRAYEECNRQAFVLACKKLKYYQPPELPITNKKESSNGYRRKQTESVE